MEIKYVLWVLMYTCISAYTMELVQGNPHLLQTSIPMCIVPATRSCYDGNSPSTECLDVLSQRRFPSYMYCEQQPKGLWHHLQKAWQDRELASHYLLACYREYMSEYGCKELVPPNIAWHYIEEKVMPHDIISLDSDQFMQTVENVWEQITGGYRVDYHEGLHIKWHSLISSRQGSNDVARALSYLEKQGGVSAKDKKAWNNFWHRVREQGKGSIDARNVQSQMDGLKERKYGERVRTMLNRVMLIIPSRENAKNHLEDVLEETRDLEQQDSIYAAAYFYHSLLRRLPFTVYQYDVAFKLLNTFLIQRGHPAIPEIYSSYIHNHAAFESMDSFGLYFSQVMRDVGFDIDHGILTDQGYSEERIVLIRTLYRTQQ